MNPKQKCGECFFWKINDTNPEVGDCRRYPPSVVGIVQTVVAQSQGMRAHQIIQGTPEKIVATRPQGVFPGMAKDDIGCGEFKLEEEEEPLYEPTLQEKIDWLDKNSPLITGETRTLQDFERATKALREKSDED